MRAQLVSGGARLQVGSFCQRDAEAGRALDCGRRCVGPGVQGERARRGGESLGWRASRAEREPVGRAGRVSWAR